MRNIQAARLSDTEGVWRMLRRFATTYEPSRVAFDRDYPRLVTAEESDLLVACEDDEVVGYLLAHRSLTLFAGGPILQIVELYVEAESRGRGVGWALVHTAVERAWRMDCVEAVVPTRRASGFYQRMGFEPTAEFLKLRRP